MTEFGVLIGNACTTVICFKRVCLHLIESLVTIFFLLNDQHNAKRKETKRNKVIETSEVMQMPIKKKFSKFEIEICSRILICLKYSFCCCCHRCNS